MTLGDVACALDAKIVCCEERASMEIDRVCASDMMSDVLAFSTPGGLLLTGLTNAQSIMTAAVADVAAIVYIRGKRPRSAVVELAKAKGIPVLTSGLSMFEACGRLYRNGLVSGTELGSGDERQR
jgi:predicted transcriptional regulator